MGIEEYLTEIKNQIRDKKAREFASEELKAHIEDRAEGLQKKGMDRDSAVLQAVKEMGDPVSVGVDLDRIHRPRLAWKFLLYVIYISILSVGVLYPICIALSSRNAGGSAFADGFLLYHIASILAGLMAMIIVYRLDYTILAGRSRLIATVFLVLLTFLTVFFGVSINGTRRWIHFGGIIFSIQALFLIYLPIFAGILYDYRNLGRTAIFKIFLWMSAPVFSQRLCGDGSISFAMFMLFSEIILFTIVVNKNWYSVDRRKFIKGAGIGFFAVAALLVSCIVKASDYQRVRLRIWLSHFGLASGNIADSDMNYTAKCLEKIFQRSSIIGKSESAIDILKNTPLTLGDYILASISATCGKLTVGVIIISLMVLATYIFGISVKQKNSLGSIVGCCCGIVIAVQALSNIFIVFGLLPDAETTLPFFSFGTSNILVDYILLGLVLSIYRYQDIRVEKEPVTTLLA